MKIDVETALLHAQGIAFLLSAAIEHPDTLDATLMGQGVAALERSIGDAREAYRAERAAGR